jgi:hypothetical protein
MAKPGYPGLVLVPPSDRRIFRRRLVRWGILILAVTSCASVITVWFPSSDKNTSCQIGIGYRVFHDSPEECDQPRQSVTEAQSHQSKFTATEVSQDTGSTKSHSAMSVQSTDTGQLATQHNTSHASMATPSGLAHGSTDRVVAAPHVDGSPGSRTANPPASSPNPDTSLAEQDDAFAQYRLGRHYARRGGPYRRESLIWYMKAAHGLRRLAEAGNGEAMYVLGVMNAFGRGVAKDHEQARRWLTQAVESQVAAARPVLASLERDRSATPSLEVSVQVQRVRHEN